MKKILTGTMALLWVLALCGCAGVLDFESSAPVEEMMTALCRNDLDAAVALLHPELAKDETANSGLQTLVEYMGGRQAVSYERTGMHVNTNFALAGRVRQESGTMVVTLDDGTKAKINYVYQTGASGNGFYGFYINFEAATMPAFEA